MTTEALVIYPTGQCFDNALDLLVDLLREDPARVETHCLVHGLCLAPDGHLYAHAWVEDGETVLSVGLVHGQEIAYAAARAEYYADARVQEVTRYSVREAYELNRQYGTYGPWRADYQALCKERTS